MAGGSATRNYNGTLAVSTVDTVTLTQYARYVLVENLGGGVAPIYVVAATTTPADPTVAGANEFAIANGQSLLIPVSGQWPSADSSSWPLSQVVVKLISSATQVYSVSLN